MEHLYDDQPPVQSCQNAGAAITDPVQASMPTLSKARRRGLNRLFWLRNTLVWCKLFICRRVFGMDLHPSVQLSLSARLDRTFPIGIHIGEASYVAFEACILTHDRTRGLYLHTWVGRHCFIGARSIILPGIRVGDGSIIAAGAVVTKDIPAGSIAAGNPAHIIRQNIQAGPYGRLDAADINEAKLAQAGLT